MNQRRKVEVPAIKNSDMRVILAEYNLADKLEKGKLHCPETGETITWANLGAIKVDKGALILYSIHAESVFATQGDNSG